jgi:hypothetical protein
LYCANIQKYRYSLPGGAGGVCAEERLAGGSPGAILN